MSDLDNRVTKLEVRVDGHDKELSKMASETEILTKSIFDIKQNVTQIKWIAVGVGLAIASQALDLGDFLKLIFTFL